MLQLGRRKPTETQEQREVMANLVINGLTISAVIKDLSHTHETNAFESLEFLVRHPISLSHIVAICLIKIRMFSYLVHLQGVLEDPRPRELAAVGKGGSLPCSIINQNEEPTDNDDIERRLDILHLQIKMLCKGVTKTCPAF